MKTYDVIMAPSDDGSWVLKSEADKENRHQKYKRCLSMVKYCDMGLTYYNEKLDSFSCERADFFYKWYNRWWKLAEKFKEAK